jgi:hypothetical protein
MDIKLFLVKSISLLFLESQLENPATSGGKMIIRQLLGDIKIQESAADHGSDRNTLNNLRTTVMWMLGNGDTQTYDLDSLLQRLRLNVQGDEFTYKALEKTIKLYGDESIIRKLAGNIIKEMKRFQAKEKLNEVLRKASYTVAFKETEVEDWDGFILQTAQDLLSIDMDNDEHNDPAFLTTVDFNNPASVQSAFEDMEQTMSTDGIIQFPFHELNNLMGKQKGGRRGEFGLVNALPGNNKSGTLLDMFMGTCLYNDPFLFDPLKKPLVLLYSTEDDVPVIIQKIYIILKQLETGGPVSARGLNAAMATQYVMEKLQARGWNVEIHRILGSAMSYAKYIQHLEKYKAKGFEVCAVFCDYLTMYSKDGCAQGSTGDDLQDLYKRVREYTNPNKILHVTAHQLSTQAKEEKRINPTKFIRDMPGGGYYQGCKKLDTEVDWEIYVNKQVVNDGSYLEYVWGKHRGVVEPTPERAKYFVMKYHEYPMYGIPYDVHLDHSLGYRAVGGKPIHSGGGSTWDDIDNRGMESELDFMQAA